MSNGEDALIGLVVYVAIIAFILYIIFLVISTVLTVTAAGGALWGGGTAVLNYGMSFKENMIDSNRVA